MRSRHKYPRQYFLSDNRHTHDTAMTDIAYVADAFNGLGFTGRGMIQSGSSNLSSWYAVNEKGALTKMQILIDAYGEL